MWHVAIDNEDSQMLKCRIVSLPITALRTVPQIEISDKIQYGEAILVALQLKAQRQLEVIASDQDERLLVLCRLIMDIQTVQERLSRERYRMSTLQP